MSFWDYFAKKLPETEKKSASGGQTLSQMLAGYGLACQNKWQWLTCTNAWNYYANVSPVNHAVDLRTDKFASIFPDVFDTKEQRFLTDAEAQRLPIGQVINLLKNPSDDETFYSFSKATSTSYPVTGDTFMLTKAISKESKPISVEYVNPCDVQTFADNDQRKVGKHQMQFGTGIICFFPEETRTGTRFYTKDGRWELYHIRTFNPHRGQSNTGQDLRGMSNLNALFIEIEQHIAGNVSNQSTLEKGVRASGLMEVGPQLDQTQRDYLKQQIEQMHAGSMNAGSVLILDGLDPAEDGLKTKFTQMSLSNKEMDFANLLKMDKRQIYNNLGAPLPLVEGETQTFNNYQHADAILYTGEILPFSKVFYPELTRFLLPRYDKKELGRYVLAIDRNKIPALDVVNTEIETAKIRTGVLTYDESRDLLGFPGLKDGGDTIYQPAALIPVGTAEQVKEVSAERLAELMQLKGYSSEEIKQQRGAKNG